MIIVTAEWLYFIDFNLIEQYEHCKSKQIFVNMKK